MKKIIIAVALTSFLSHGVFAQDAGSVLGGCMVDSLNGKERKNLAKWIFFAIAAHPEMKTHLNASDKDIDNSDRYVGELITRLLIQNCPEELKTANSADPLALNNAFELVGRVAMQELMTDPSVLQAITNYANYTDQDAINKLLVNP